MRHLNGLGYLLLILPLAKPLIKMAKTEVQQTRNGKKRKKKERRGTRTLEVENELKSQFAEH